MMESDLATTSANSLRTLGCIWSAPMDLCIFKFLRCSQTWSSLNKSGNSFPQSLPWGSRTWEIWQEWLPVKTDARNLWSNSDFSMFIVTSSAVLFVGEEGTCS